MSVPKPGPRSGAPVVRRADRQVHARSASGTVVLVRYDKQGRWYLESPNGGVRVRVATVHEAAQKAVAMENEGGKVFEGIPGGKQFDSKVAGCRRRGTR